MHHCGVMASLCCAAVMVLCWRHDAALTHGAVLPSLCRTTVMVLCCRHGAVLSSWFCAAVMVQCTNNITSDHSPAETVCDVGSLMFSYSPIIPYYKRLQAT